MDSVFDLLKKYYKYEIAERECEKHKCPYNIIKCHEIYVKHIDDIIIKLNKQKEKSDETIKDIEKLYEAKKILKQIAQKDFELR